MRYYKNFLLQSAVFVSTATIGAVVLIFVKDYLASLREWYYILPLLLACLVFIAWVVASMESFSWPTLIFASSMTSIMFFLSGAIIRGVASYSSLPSGFVHDVENSSAFFYIFGFGCLIYAFLATSITYIKVVKPRTAREQPDRSDQ